MLLCQCIGSVDRLGGCRWRTIILSVSCTAATSPTTAGLSVCLSVLAMSTFTMRSSETARHDGQTEWRSNSRSWSAMMSTATQSVRPSRASRCTTAAAAALLSVLMVRRRRRTVATTDSSSSSSSEAVVVASRLQGLRTVRLQLLITDQCDRQRERALSLHNENSQTTLDSTHDRLLRGTIRL